MSKVSTRFAKVIHVTQSYGSLRLHARILRFHNNTHVSSLSFAQLETLEQELQNLEQWEAVRDMRRIADYRSPSYS